MKGTGMRIMPMTRTIQAVVMFCAVVFSGNFSFADEIGDLVAKTESNDFSTKVTAISELGKIKDAKAVDYLIKILKEHPDGLIRQSAAQALVDPSGPVDPRAAEPLIQALMTDKSDDVRYSAAMALVNFFDDRQVLSPLIHAIDDSSGRVKEAVLVALGELANNDVKDPKVVEAAMKALNDPEYSVRSAATRLLAYYKEDPGIAEKKQDPRRELDRYMEEFAETQNEEIRKEIIGITAKLDPPPAIPEEAQRAMARGKVEFKNAQDPPEFDKAAQEFQKAADLAPWWPDAYFNLGLVKEKQAEYDNALFSFNLYLLAAPGASDAQAVKEKIYQLEYLKEQSDKAIEIGNQGAALQNAGRSEEAVQFLRDAIKLNSAEASLHATLGAIYVSLKRDQDAIPELKEGIRLGYKDLTTYFRLAVAYENAEQNYDEAINVLEEGLKVDPDPNKPGLYGPLIASVYKNLGSYYDHKYNYEKAAQNYEQAIEYGHTEKDSILENIRRCKKISGE